MSHAHHVVQRAGEIKRPRRGDVQQRPGECSPRSRRHPAEAGELAFARSAEVRVAPLGRQPQPGCAGAHFRRVLRGETQAVHTRVEFEMERGRTAHGGERVESRLVAHGYREPEIRRLGIFRSVRRRDQHGSGNAALAKRPALLEDGDAEHVRVAFAGARHPLHAVPVGVGFDHEQHPAARSGAHGGNIAPDPCEIDFDEQFQDPPPRPTRRTRHILCRTALRVVSRAAFERVPPRRS